MRGTEGGSWVSESVSSFEVMLLEPLGLKNKKENFISFLATHYEIQLTK